MSPTNPSFSAISNAAFGSEGVRILDSSVTDASATESTNRNSASVQGTGTTSVSMSADASTSSQPQPPARKGSKYEKASRPRTVIATSASSNRKRMSDAECVRCRGTATASSRSKGIGERVSDVGWRTHVLPALGATTMTPPVPVRHRDLKSTPGISGRWFAPS